MNKRAKPATIDASRPVSVPGLGMGAAVERREDERLVTGQGRFANNVTLPRQLYGHVLRSPIGHARIRSIDVTEASTVPGLVAILTGEDYAADGFGLIPCVSIPPSITGKTYHATPFSPLAQDRVLCVGAEVAFIIATSAEAAEDAAELIRVDYDPLPAAPTLEAAIAPGAPRIWPEAEGNICFRHTMGDAAATEAAFAAAHHVTRATIRNQRLAGVPMEPRTCIGSYDTAEGRWRLTSSTANPHRIRLLLAEHIFRVPANRIHVTAGDVGGGFGTKGGLYPEEILVLWAAWRIGRPVKWVSSRSESFLADFNGRDQIADAELALDATGRVLAMRAKLHHNLGCMLGPSTAHPPLVGSRMLSGVYAFPAMHVEVNGVFTNSRTLTTYRGAGRPEATMIVERLMDMAAAEMGLDPVEIRRKNFIAPTQMPYRTAIGETYDCGEFGAITEDTLRLADWNGFAARRAETEAKGRLRGRGLSCYIEVCATISERMELRFDSAGGLTILAGTFSYGQGHETTYAQMVHGWLGVPMDRIRMVQGDTDIIFTGRGSFGSRSMTVGGSALRQACDQIIAKGRRMAALLMGVPEAEVAFADGAFQGGGKCLTLDHVARTAFAWGVPKSLPADMRNGLEGVGYFTAEPQNYPNGCYVAEVEIDPATGDVTVDRLSGIDDVGVVVNPLLLEGQVIGGAVQALGQALKEAVVHDASGQVLSGSFTDYAMPRAADVPRMRLDTRAVPTLTNPLGVKGGAETGTIGLPPAIIGAVVDALRPYGIRDIAMPATPARIWAAIETARKTAK